MRLTSPKLQKPTMSGRLRYWLSTGVKRPNAPPHSSLPF